MLLRVSPLRKFTLWMSEITHSKSYRSFFAYYLQPSILFRVTAEMGAEHSMGEYIMYLRAEQEPQALPHTMYKMAETFPDPHWADSCSR